MQIEKTLLAFFVEWCTWHFGDVDQVDDAKVFDLFRDGEQRLVHLHAVRVPVVAEANQHDFVLLAQDGLSRKKQKINIFLLKNSS